MSQTSFKNRLFLQGLKEKKCERCDLTIWRDRPIPLELHHIDGNNNNNELNNLQVLCPNCHALTDNYRGKNKKGAKQGRAISIEEILKWIPESYSIRNLLINLKLSAYGGNYPRIKKILNDNPEIKFKKRENVTKIKNNTKEDMSSYNPYNATKPEGSLNYSPTKIKWPENNILAELVWQKSIRQLAQELGVTDNAIYHRCKYRNIATPPIGYWRKLEVGKIKECEEIKQKCLEKMLAEGFEPTI